MNAKHTPGPWEIDQSEKYYRPCIRKNGVIICFLPEKQIVGDEKERKANAALLCFSPTLLAACEAVLNLCDNEGNLPENGEFSGAAIAEAVREAVRLAHSGKAGS